MLNLKYVSENPEKVKTALSKRNGTYDVDRLILLDSRRKEIINEVEALKAKKNKVSKQIPILKKENKPTENIFKEMKELGETIKNLDSEFDKVKTEIQDLLYSIPNLPHDSVPAGNSDEENIELRKYGTPRVDNVPAHWDIGEDLKILNFKEAGKITGARFTVYHGLGARLERAIINLMLDTHMKNGYEEIMPPYMVNTASMYGTGQLPKFAEDMFKVENTDYYLIPTAEVPVTNLLRGEIVNEDLLPIKYCAFTACFRAEAGSAGRDTRGLIRQHQFNKVELVKFVKPDDSFDELEKLTNNAEEILQLLELPYRVVTLCSGDLGFSSAKTYDIEVWMPSYNKYVEISSCSNFLDYQARRANIKYRDENGKPQLVHTLNGSGLAVGRTVAAVLENYYDNETKSVKVPKVLQKYIGTDIIK